VRDVAPRKLMMCLSFPLPPEAAFAPSPAADGVDPRASEEATLPSEEGTAFASAPAPDEGEQREAKRAKP